MTTRVIASTCKECSVRCGSLIYLEDDRVVKITGNPNHPGSKGAFCVKGVHGPVTAREHPDRPLHPLRRAGERGEGRWERISWDEAFDAIAQRMGGIKREFGATAIAGAVSNHFVSRGVAMTQLLRSLGSPNYMINQDLCQGCRYTASLLTGVGAQPGNELPKSRCILVIGKSPSDSSVVQWMHVKEAKRAGAQLIVVDPRRTHIARLADQWLQIRPGTDAALALSMIHVMFSEDLIDADFVRDWCTGTEELRERAAQYPAAIAANIAGVPAEAIIKAARTFATMKPGSLVLGHGIDAQANGVKTTIAFHALLALSGNIDRPGTNRMPKQQSGFRDYYSVINDPAFRLPKAIESQIIGGEEYPLWSGPESWSKSAHNPSLIRAINTGEPYPVKALYASGVNIACTYPDIENTIAALKKLDLLVVASDHLTPTAELADFVLPKTTLLEEEDISADQSAPCLAAVQRAVPPRGEAKTDIEIAIGLRDALRKRGDLEFELFPWNSHRELIDFQLQGTGISFDEVCEHGYRSMPVTYEDYRKRGFKTPSGKIDLCPNRLRDIGIDPLPDYRPPVYAQPPDGFDLVLLTGIRSMALHHSRFRNHGWARKLEDAPELRINPKTAARYRIAGNDWVWVATPHVTRKALLKASITDEMPENVVATGMGWWYPEMSGSDHGSLTFNIDAALPYGPPWDPISGSAEARNSACTISRADPAEVPLLKSALLRGEIQMQLVQETQAQSAVRAIPTPKPIGTDIVGVDLSKPLSDADFKTIFDAWMERLVLRFRGQTLTKEQLLDFSARFGVLDKAPINIKGEPWIAGYPNLAVMSNIMENGQPVGSLGYGEAVWHTDMSYNEVTASGALLYALEVTKSGGETGFLNMYHAYETLPADLKAAIEGREIKHDASRNSAGELRKGYKEVTDPRDAPGAVHPIVIRHPVTKRRALFLGRRPFGYVVGLRVEESEQLLDRLWAHATREEFAWFQKWSVGDLLMWDNRCAMHKRTAFDPNERRFMLRTQIKGARPAA